jgi:hypothetical protein
MNPINDTYRKTIDRMQSSVQLPGTGSSRGKEITVNRSMNLKVVMVAVVLVAIALAPAAAREIATMQAVGGSIQWAPKVEYDRLVLTVSGGGVVIREEFERGVAPSFRLTDREGNALPDGSYTWDLLVVPRAESLNRDAYGNAERSEDGSYERMARYPKGESQAGYFLIQNGAVVDNSVEEPRPSAPASGPEGAGPGLDGSPVQTGDGDPIQDAGGDFVINQDLIVDGSACIGFDCVNGESFGFDTIRIKENNLRIRAMDTSNSASFPTNDWQLTFNDSSNGGANKFSIDDIDGSKTPFTIEANAPSHSLYVDDGGRIGNGTSTPVTDIHVRSGNTPTLRLEQDGSSGFTPQTWDVAGNEANFFIRDATNGSQLPFKIRPGADSNSLFIDADNEVGLGTTSPLEKFHVEDGQLRIRDDSGGSPGFQLDTDARLYQFLHSAGNGSLTIQDIPSGGSADDIILIFADQRDNSLVLRNDNLGLGVANPGSPIEHSNGATLTAGGVWMNGSSRELKQDIEELGSDEAMAVLEDLSPVKYAYKLEADEQYVGFIAEDVPELVAGPERKGLSSMEIVAVLTKAVQEQQKEITELRELVQELAAQQQ